MILFVFVILTGLAVLIVLWPLWRPAGQVWDGEADVAFYRAVIADLSRGLIDPAGALFPMMSSSSSIVAICLLTRGSSTSAHSVSAGCSSGV
ncbi:hypothetical protein GGD83_001801 [Rhodoblastus sphagnicola]|nr:hypothetical protein [Rhodoblastus sphagnicola]